MAVIREDRTLIQRTSTGYQRLPIPISEPPLEHSQLGQDPGKIPASPKGYQPPSIGKGQHQGQPGARHECCYTGKVAELFYDWFGDFEGFELKCCGCEQHSFRSCEPDLEELIYLAWTERFVITVCVCRHDAHKVESVALLRTPRH